MQLTYADLVVADMLDTAEMHAPGLIDKFKKEFTVVYGVWKKTNEDERVKAYKQKRGPKKLPHECVKARKEVLEMSADKSKTKQHHKKAKDGKSGCGFGCGSMFRCT